MLTRCPNCSTTFRVTPGQLKARGGQVRCGQCDYVFNALDTLVENMGAANPSAAARSISADAAHATDAASANEIAALADAGTPDVVFDIGEVEAPPQSVVMTDSSPPWQEPAQETVPETTERDTDATDKTEATEATDTIDEALIDAATEASMQDEAAATPASVPHEVVADNITLTPTPYLTDYLAEPILHDSGASTRRWPWIAGSVLALTLLLAQLTYYYRVEIAVLQPALRPLLQDACEVVGCEVPRPRTIDMLGIEASDLRPDPQQTGHLSLTATLRNKAPYAQEWPLLELTITDVADQKLAVKHFSARDYLPKAGKDAKALAATLASGFPVNGQLAITLPLDVGDLPAAGYRLYIFYP